MATTASTTFGALLRQHRLAAGLTQEGLAERAGVSARGVQDLERGLRTTPRAETVRLLADALGLDPESRSRLIAAAHPELTIPAPPGATPLPLGALPVPPTSIVGRESEIAAVCALLRHRGGDSAARLVTLTGPGGVGKTRLALAVAAALAGDYADGVAWVELAPLHDPELVASAIARVLGVREDSERPLVEGLTLALTGRRVLLVLDNCEHLMPAVPLLGQLLASCPQLVVLATSRARLRLRGEREFPVDPLALPPTSLDTASPLTELADVAAVRLFVARAADIRPDFTLASEHAAAVAAICRKLEGLPLALELAAVRVKLLPPAALLARLEQGLSLLAGGARDLPLRQQTMRSTIAWSHELLTADEQVIFRRLAVFVGGFTLEAAEDVGGRFAEGGRFAQGGERGEEEGDEDERLMPRTPSPPQAALRLPPQRSAPLPPFPPFSTRSPPSVTRVCCARSLRPQPNRALLSWRRYVSTRGSASRPAARRRRFATRTRSTFSPWRSARSRS